MRETELTKQDSKLLDAMQSKAASHAFINWQSVFADAAKRTKKNIELKASNPSFSSVWQQVRYVAFWQALYVSLFLPALVALIVFGCFSSNSTVAGLSILGAFVGGLLGGIFAFLFADEVYGEVEDYYEDRRKRASTSTDAIIPNGIRYSVKMESSVQHPGGEAVITRQAPVVSRDDGTVSMDNKEFMRVPITAQGVIDITGQFDDIVKLVRIIQEEENSPYKKLMKQHGLDPASIGQTNDNLRRQVEFIREQLITNKGVYASLNEYADSDILDESEDALNRLMREHKLSAQEATL